MFLNYYFHAILRTDSIFTHVYYIPVVSSTIWWKKKGLYISIILSAALIIGHLILSPHISIWEDAIKSVIIISISYIILILSKKIEELNDELKNNIKKIEAALKEKDTLLHEIHHRVKNNLQIVSSLLYLQSKNISDKASQKIFDETRNQIRLIALVHEKLYKSENFSRISVKEYVKNLINTQLNSYGVKNKIKVNYDFEDIYLDMNKAINFGLIINEIASNSIKYAFPNDKNGQMGIKFHMKNNSYNLVIGDNGKGLPKSFNLSNTKSLGLGLVKQLVNQMDGNLNIECSNGTEFQISIPKVD